MTNEEKNPRISALLRGLTLIEVVVLVAAGGGLFFLTDLARAAWMWEIPPFNARFVGAVYLTSMAAVAMMLVSGRWAPARLVLPMLFTFTFVVLVMTLLHLDRFHFERWSAWGWMVLYIVLPINAAYHVWLYRRWPPADPTPLPAPWRWILRVVGAVLGGYGLIQFFAPEAVSGFWPWSIDAFHGQMYSANFLTAAIGAIVLSVVAAPTEYLTLGIVYTVLGFFSILGLVLVDASARSVDWAAPGTWIWVGTFALLLIFGLGLMIRARRLGSPSSQRR